MWNPQDDYHSQGLAGFSNADQIWAVKGERRDGKKYWDAADDAKLQIIVSNQHALEKSLFLCAKHTCAWTSLQGITVTGTVFAATKFSDFMCLLQS